MEVSWLEDYLALRELGSFTEAAERRNSSQSAFSRRIQSLEAWLGVKLVDRNHRPYRFTSVALEHDAEFRNLLNRFQDLRGRLRGEEARCARLRVAVQHSLSISLFPRLANKLGEHGIQPVYHLSCGNRADCIEMMLGGQADLLICYETPKLASMVPASIAERLATARDEIVIVATPNATGKSLPSQREGEPLSLLGYPHESFFGELVWDQIMPKLAAQFRLEIVCVSAFTSALRAMALAGRGATCLPLHLVKNDLETKRLVTFKAKTLRYPLIASIYVSPEAESCVSGLRAILTEVDLQGLMEG